MTGLGTRMTRSLKWLGRVLRHPVKSAKATSPFGWSEQSVIYLVRHTLDNAIAFGARRGWFGRISLRTEQDPEKPNPTFIDVANEAADVLARETGGGAQSGILEALANIPTTAHIRRGAVVPETPE